MCLSNKQHANKNEDADAVLIALIRQRWVSYNRPIEYNLGRIQDLSNTYMYQFGDDSPTPSRFLEGPTTEQEPMDLYTRSVY